MESRMSVALNQETGIAKIRLSTVYKGYDKVKEFGAFQLLHKKAENFGMVWNKENGDYTSEIVLSPETAAPFKKYCDDGNAQLILG